MRDRVQEKRGKPGKTGKFTQATDFNVNKSNARPKVHSSSRVRREWTWRIHFHESDVYCRRPVKISGRTGFLCLVRVNLLSEAREQ